MAYDSPKSQVDHQPQGGPDRVKPFAQRRRLIALVGALFASLFIGGCQQVGTLPPATDQAIQITDLYNAVFTIAAVVFVLVEGLIIWSVIRYRRKSTDRSLPAQTHGNFLLEIVWTLIPLITVVGIFVASIGVLNSVDARDASTAEVKVEVVGYQWQWKFAYPDAGIEVFGTAAQEPQLVVPLGKVIQVSMSSQDVNHGFYIPEFLFQRDAVPGQVNVFQFTPNKIGTFHGQCSAFCGLLHHAMRFSVKVVSPEEYDTWLTDNAPKPAGFTAVRVGI
jgi:cytochrome c oxidase subunit 2